MKKIAITIVAIVVTIVVVLVALFVVGRYTRIEQLLKPKNKPAEHLKKKETPKERAVRKKIEHTLAKEIMSQQRESKENLSRLADGQIKKIVMGKVTTIPDEASVAIEVFYTDRDSLSGAMSFWRRNEMWYLTEITRQPRLPNPPTETLVENLTEEDIAVGEKIVSEQTKHQEVITDLVTGQIKELKIDKVDSGTETATVYVTTYYVAGSKLRVAIDMSFVNGYWYIVRMYEK